MPSTKRPTAMVKPFFNTVRRDNELTKRSPTRMKTLERWIPRKPVRNSKIKNQKSKIPAAPPNLGPVARPTPAAVTNLGKT